MLLRVGVRRKSSSIAILLISADFLTSKFIQGQEMPRLLERRDKEGLHILPVVIKSCPWQQVGWLEQMNMYPKDANPLACITDHEVDTSLTELSSQILIKTRRSRPPVRPPLPGPDAVFAGALKKDGAPQSPASEPNAERLQTEEAVLQELVSGTTFLAPQHAAQEHHSNGRIKVLVNHIDDPAAKPDSFVFRQKRIIMGRNPGCDLPLPDNKRVISKRHAEITWKDDRLYRSDLDSINATHLNKEQIEPHHPYEMQTGDTIWIGDFEISVEILDTPTEPDTAAQVDDDLEDATSLRLIVNPYEADVKQLVDVLRSLGEQYAGETSRRNKKALHQALHAVLEHQDQYEVYLLIAHLCLKHVGKPDPDA